MSIVVGLTGGIASGKSTVSSMLIKKGITVIDADVEARLAVEKGEEAYEEIVEQFGEQVLLEDRSIDRGKLGSIVFNNETERQILNSIVHPRVRGRMIKKKEEAIGSGEQLIVMDIPLLFESGLTSMVDKTLLVYVNEETQLKRLMERNNLTKKDALARIQSQMPLKEKIHLADAVIDNNGSVTDTEKQLTNILNRWNVL